MIELKNAAPEVSTEARKDSSRAVISSRDGQYKNQKWRFSVAQFLTILGKSVIFVSVLLAVLAFVEVIFSLAHVGEDTVVQPDPLTGFAHLANQETTYRLEGHSSSRTNSMGFREKEIAVPKPAGLTRIVVLGDSVTTGLEVPPERNFAKLLESRLQAAGRKNLEVLNCGLTGFGTGQEYLLYKQKIAKLQPDVLIVAFHLGDVDDDMAASTNPPRPTFALSPQGKLQVDFRGVDKWLASFDSRYYSSFEQVRRNSRILALLTRAQLVMSSDPAYKACSKAVGPACDYLWKIFLQMQPAGDWRVAESRSEIDKTMIFGEPTAAKTSVVSTPAKTAVPGAVEAPAPVVAAPAAAASPAAPAAAAAAAPAAPAAAAPAPAPAPAVGVVAAVAPAPVIASNGQQDIDLYRGYLWANNSRVEVSKAILAALYEDCKKNNCELVVAGLPAYSNSVFYTRQMNALRAFAKEKNFKFVDSWKAYPSRDPMQPDDNFYSVHFNYKGHKVMADTLYEALVQQ